MQKQVWKITRGKKQTFVRILSLMLALVMVAGLVPVDAFAREGADAAGTDGGAVTVLFDPDNGIDDPFAVTVQAGETVAEPTPPTVPYGMTSFLGWFAPEADESFDFAGAAVTEDLTLTARYSAQMLVQFKDRAGEDGNVIHSQSVGAADPVDYFSPSAEILGLREGEYFTYWYIEGGDPGTPFVFDQLISHSIALVPYISDSFYVVFHTGGSAVEPALVQAGETVTPPENPERTGYTFSHWSLHEDGGAYDFTAPVEESFTLYAVWTPEIVTYSVVYWIEAADLPDGPQGDGDYTFLYSEKRDALADTAISTETGELVEGTTAVGDLRDAEALSVSLELPVLKYAEFTRGDAATVKGDGTGTVNVYYDRIVYTYVFDLAPADADPVSGVLQLQEDGPEYREREYVLQLKYGQEIPEGAWPENGHITIEPGEYSLVGWLAEEVYELYGGQEVRNTWSTKRDRLADDMMPFDRDDTTITVNAQYSDNVIEVNPSYYIQTLSDDYPTEQYPTENILFDSGEKFVSYGPYGNFNGYEFRFSDEYSVPFLMDASLSLKHKDIAGLGSYGSVYYVYEEDEEDFPIAAHDKPYLFYFRNQYNLTLDACGGDQDEGSYSYPYGSSIEDYLSSVFPTRGGYEFTGWYLHPDYEGDGEFDPAGQTMPAYDLTLYAHWEPVEQYVYFYTDYESPWPYQTQGLGRGDTVDFQKSGLPQVGDVWEDYGEFLGWLYLNPNGMLVQYPVDDPVYTDLKLFGNWRTDGFTVTYDSGGHGEAPADGNRYRFGTYAQILPGDELAPPTGYVFVGWQVDGLGKCYYPGNHYLVTGDTHLVAKYVPSGDAALLTYYANDGTTDAISYYVELGVDVELLGEDTFTRENHVLEGWSLTEDGDVDYALGETTQLTGDLELYAVWRPLYTVRYDSNGGEGTVIDPDTYFAGDEATVRAHTDTSGGGTGMSRTGYGFKAWNTQPDGSGTAYAADDAIKIEDDVILYAIWSPDSYQLTYYANDGSTKKIEQSVEHDENVTLLGEDAFDRDKHVLQGWSLKEDGDVDYALGEEIKITGDLELYAIWAETFTVAYRANGGEGTVIDPATYFAGDEATVKAHTDTSGGGTGMSRTGYGFKEWNTQPDGSGTAYAADDAIDIGDDVILYAIWSPDSYQLTYYANDGSADRIDESVEHDENVTLLGEDAFDRDKHVLQGWSQTEDGDIDYALGEEIKITGDLELYAVWAETFTVEYRANGGEGTVIDPDTYFAGDEATVKAHTDTSGGGTGMSRTGYGFKAWNTERDGSGTAYAAGASIEIKDDVTLYAIWSPDSYQLTYYANDGTDEKIEQSVEHDENVTLLGEDAFDRDKHVLQGWSLSEDGDVDYALGEEIKITGDLELYAVWAETFTVAYRANGGEGTVVDPETYFAGDEATVRAHTDTSGGGTGMSRDGYGFKEWNTEPDGSGTVYAADDAIKIEDDVTLYAIWSPDSYQLTYYANDGTDEKFEQSVEHDENVTLLGEDAFTRDKHVLQGWSLSEDRDVYYALGEEIEITGDLELYAVWAETFTVAYRANGGTGTVVDPETYFAGDEATVKAHTDTSGGGTGMSRDGYGFKAWNTERDGSGTAYAAGDAIEIEDDVILYAIWSTDIYQLTYYANDGSADRIDESVEHGENVTLLGEDAFDRDKHVLQGWSLKEDGDMDYALGEEIKITGNLELYAVWVETFTVAYRANGGEGTVLDPATYFAGDEATVRAHTDTSGGGTGMSRTGYGFKAWNTQPDGSGTAYAADDAIEIEDDVILYAIWSTDIYQLTYYANDGSADRIDESVEHGENVTLLGEDAFDRDKHVLQGWSQTEDGDIDYALGEEIVIIGDLELYAVWAETFTVAYRANGGTGTVLDPNTYFAGDKATVRAHTDTSGGGTGMSRDGYEFKAWNTAGDGSGTAYIAGGQLTVEADIVLYAIWEEDEVVPEPTPDLTEPTPTPDDEPEPSLDLSEDPEPTPTPDETENPDLNYEDHFAYIIGYPDGTIRPEGEITRAEVTTIFFRLLKAEARERYWDQENSFSDVALGDWCNNAISTMTNMGIIEGYPDGTFRPDQPITRAELAAIVSRLAVADPDPENIFIDNEGHWAELYISRVAALGWVEGYEDGTYRPDNDITRAEVATTVNRVMKRVPETVDDLLEDMTAWSDNSDTEKWYYLTIQEATHSHSFARKEDGYHIYWLGYIEPPDWTLLEKIDSKPWHI